MPRKLFPILAVAGLLLIFRIIENSALPLPYGRVYYHIGLNFEKKGAWQKALKYYEKSVRTDPGLAEAEYQLGTVYRNQGEDLKAVSHFQNAAYLNPDYHQAYYALAGAYFKAGYCSEALAALNKAFNAFQYHYRKVPEYFSLLSQFYLCVGDTEAAQRANEQLKELEAGAKD